MNILMIGNGFDLAHGLPTKYSDFLGFIEYFKIFFDANESDIQDRYKEASSFKKLNENVQAYLLEGKNRSKAEGSLSNELYEIASNNIWISHLAKCHRNNKLKGENWIDFESEICKIIRGLEYYKGYTEENIRVGGVTSNPTDIVLFENGYDFWHKNNNKFNLKDEFYEDGAKKFISKMNDELNELIRCLEIYLEDVVGKIDIKKKIVDINDKQIDKLISFNYTYTFKKIYDKDDSVETDYIHGSLDINRNIKENNMVLGIDEYLEGNKKQEELDFIKFKKYFQRIYKKTGCKYKKWIPKMCNKEKNGEESEYLNNIYIYGHSLDITDKDILKELILCPNTQVNIFYYDEDDYAEKIKNMVALIEQDNLIAMVYGENPKIIFQEIER